MYSIPQTNTDLKRDSRKDSVNLFRQIQKMKNIAKESPRTYKPLLSYMSN